MKNPCGNRAIRTAAATLSAAAFLILAACETTPVTNRKQLVLISEDQAAEMGAQAYRQILTETPAVENSDQTRRVRGIGGRIAEAVGAADRQWEFNVIPDDTPNAFALPGGKVGVNSGLFKIVENDAQLAAVMAHEIAHVTARHSSERLSRQLLVQGGVQGVGAIADSEQLASLAGTLATLGLVLPFTRDQEAEADEIGLTYMARAGYDPQAAVEVWKRFRDLGGDRPPEFLSTHPAPESRIARLQALVPKVMPIYRQSAGQR